jgi:hypothetical protein
MHKNVFVPGDPWGFYVDISGCMPSGTPNTTVDNSLAHVFHIITMMVRQKPSLTMDDIEDSRHLIYSDDGAYDGRYISKETCVNYIKEMSGKEPGQFEMCLGQNGAFLGRKRIVVDGQPVNYNSYNKSMDSLVYGNSSDDPLHFHERIEGLYLSDAFNPMYSAELRECYEDACVRARKIPKTVSQVHDLYGAFGAMYGYGRLVTRDD